jgi:hypothetical protein
VAAVDVTVRQLNRATLDRQLLLKREQLSVSAAMHRVLALQAQEPPSPYLALWDRIEGFQPADLDAAFFSHEIVKATLMRITLHAVLASEYSTFHEAMQGTLRDSRLYDRRFRSSGVPIEAAEALLPHVLDFLSVPRRNADVDAMVAEHLDVDPKHYVWWALRTFGPVWRAPNGGSWAFGAYPEYIAATRDDMPDRTGCIQYLFHRYLEAFGPASRHDFGQFALLRQSEVKPALAGIADQLVHLDGPNGEELYDICDAVIPDEATLAPPRLLPMWDNVLLVYKDRRRIIPEDYRKVILRTNGDSLPALLVDGYVAGVWRPVDGGIEATAFHSLDDDTWDGLALEARNLLEFLGEREPSIYSRYAYWWSKLPAGEVRMLGTG